MSGKSRPQVQDSIPAFIRDGLYLYPTVYGENDYFPVLADLDVVRETLKSNQDKTMPEILAYSKDLFDGEEERQKLLENKAAIIAGFSGTIFAALLAFNEGLFEASTFGSLSRHIRVVIVIIYILIDLALLNSIRCSLESLFIREYRYPHPASLLKKTSQDIAGFQRELASRYLRSYAHNYAANSKKAHAFQVSLKSFRFAAFLTAAVIITFVVNAPNVTLDNVSRTLIPYPTQSPTITTMPTNTVTPHPTMTPIPDYSVSPIPSITTTISP
jgi:hypothetical protein